MRRALFLRIIPLLLVASLPATAEEIALKDGTKIVGHMTSIQGDKIEVETAYGKMQLKRADIIAINFPENSPAAPAASAGAKDVPQNIDEVLNGTQYINKSAKFTLVVPDGWKINPKLPRTAPIVTGLSSADQMRFLMVTREEYSGSIESYKGLLELQYRRTFGGYEELSESPATIDGKSGMVFLFRGTSAKADNLPLEFLVAIIPSGSTYTRVATWCVEPLFHETQPMFEKMVNSYHSNGTPALAQAAKP